MAVTNTLNERLLVAAPSLTKTVILAVPLALVTGANSSRPVLLAVA